MTESEQILTSVLQCERIDLYTRFHPLQLTPEQEARRTQMQQRRQEGEPLQYILGECDFMGLRLNVDRRALIPRPETEILVEKLLEYVKEFYSPSGAPLRILDVGTGSGNIAVALAKFIPSARLTAVDISPAALTLARENAVRHAIDHRIRFVCSSMQDFFQAQSSVLPPFDIIVSNPPYIPRARISRLPRDVQQEPHLALDGGADGLDHYRCLIGNSSKFLGTNACLVLELGDGQRTPLEELFKQHPDFKKVSFYPDHTGTDRIAVAEPNSFKSMSCRLNNFLV